MRKTILFIFICILSVQMMAGPGDTIFVQTLTFDDITKRRDTYIFPDESVEFRKILMYYTLKCDPATTQDGFACGEWDYLTYNFVYDHTGNLDSNLLTHPLFTVNGLSPAEFSYSSTPTYNYMNIWQYFPVYDNVISENSFPIGNNSEIISHPFQTNNKTSKAQYLWLPAELSTAGISPGDIHKIMLNIQNAETDLNYLTIKMKNSSLSELSSGSHETSGFSTVYNMNTSLLNGLNEFSFTLPFSWDGTSAIAIEICFQNPELGISSTVSASDVGFNAGLFSNADDHYLSFNGADYINIPVDQIQTIDSFVTVSFWQYGAPDFQPQDDYIFEAVNESGNRVLNVHLPWSNERVYWDAGNEAASYDRIDKFCPSTLYYKGKWNYWTFTKNVATGSMKMYFNGILWHSATGMNREMSGISKFVIGSNKNFGGNYDGHINEFCVFNAELDIATINNYMYKDIDASHPNYANLVAYYNFDEGAGILSNDNSVFENQASLMGMPEWKLLVGEEILRNLTATNLRPDISFVQGSYDFHLDSVLFQDSIMNSPVSILFFNDTALLPLSTDTLLVWDYGWNYVTENGVVIDSVYFPLSNTIINDINTYWSEPFEIINRYEIGRYITPYGIGLSLGAEGFTWVYDVTDYDFLFRNEVDFAAGNQQELIDVKFAMIEGTPPRNLLEMKRIWGPMASYYFKDIDQSDDPYLNTIKYLVHTDAESFKIKTRITGHGHNSNDGSYPHCCEWLDNSHYLYVNDLLVDTWKIFQYDDCALNPVFPQGGTWPGSREGWCPGDVVKENEFEVASFVDSDSIAIDYDISDVPAINLGMGWGNYVFAAHLFQYGAANFQYDAEIMDVITPNKWEYYSRKNPICSNPKIIIRNSGAETLTALTLNYSVSGGPVFTYEWTGSLPFMESEIIELPVNSGAFWMGDGNNRFTVQLSQPNGVEDENFLNDSYNTNFQTPDIYDENFIILLRSNNIPGDNYYHIMDINGDTVYSKTGLVAATTYYDTIYLDPGCYELVLRDLGNDGLSYWAYTAQGTGYARIKKIGGTILKYFESEFGHSIHYAFSISDVSNMKEIELSTFEVFPNPSDGNFNIDLAGYSGKTKIEVFDKMGKIIYSNSLYLNEALTIPINIQNSPSGMYLVKVQNKGKIETSKIVVN